MGFYADVARAIGDKPWFRPVARKVLPVVDKVLVRMGWRATPWPTLLLTTLGRKTGTARNAPLYFVETNGGPAVLATNYGQQEPAWSHNLRANQNCQVTLRRATNEHRARLATTDEWSLLFERFAEFYPAYRTYLERAERDVPMWILEPA